MENNEFTQTLNKLFDLAKQYGIKVSVNIVAGPDIIKPLPEIITKEQHDVLIKDLECLPGVAKDIMNFYNIPTLAQLPVDQFDKTRERIYKIKKTYEEYKSVR